MMRVIVLFLLFVNYVACYESSSLIRKKVLEDKDEKEQKPQEQHRKLAAEPLLVSYEPSSRVSDLATIDLDVMMMEMQLGPLIPNANNYSFANAREIYTQGANSKPYASIVLRSGQVISRRYPKGALVTGRAMAGRGITGTLKREVNQGDTDILVTYDPADIFGNYDCRVGANPNPELDGCFEGAGQISIEGDSYGYIYTPRIENLNDEALQFFSTRAQDEMYRCDHCPYEDFEKFYDYFGHLEYGNEFIMAAFNRISTGFNRGNADFGELTRIAYKNIIETASLVLNVWMYVVKEMESAIDSCTNHKCSSLTPSQCDTDYDAHNWDRAVALYTGSLQKESTSGFLLYNLANKRCSEFGTCSSSGNNVRGDAKINYDVLSRFTSGRRHLLAGDCTAARGDKESIVRMMTVPLVQGTLRHAFLDEVHFDSDNRGQGAIYAASILPFVHSCNENDALTIYENLHTRAGTTDFVAVKRALERNYECMNIACEMVGGMMERNGNGFVRGGEPCGSYVMPEVHASYTNGAIPGPSMTPYPVPVTAPPGGTSPPRVNSGGSSSHRTRSHYNNTRLNLGALIGACVLVTLSGCVVLILCRTWRATPIIKDGEEHNYGIEIRETPVANGTSYNSNGTSNNNNADDDEPSFTIT